MSILSENKIEYFYFEILYKEEIFGNIYFYNQKNYFISINYFFTII